MTTISLLNLLAGYAEEYRPKAAKSMQRNRHMNSIDDEELVQQRHIDAVLVDFINYVGTRNGVDYALYTRDINGKAPIMNGTSNND